MQTVENVVSFPSTAAAINAKFKELSQGELYVTDIPGDLLWESYLKAFPPGTDPMFRVRTEHDCSCCRNFIKNIGNVVNGDLVSVWDVEGLPEPYATVAAAMSRLVKSQPIISVFRTKQPSYGAEFTWEDTIKWHHFHGSINSQHKHSEADRIRGEVATVVGVFQRGLEELKPEAIAEVLDLIDSNSIYRGAEHKAVVVAFQNIQREYLKLDFKGRQLLAWKSYKEPCSRLKNTVIGSLIQDLSEGKDIENAVKSFEQKVAPENYKRPKSLITPAMIEKATATLKELNLESALHRRFAKISDVSVNNVLFVDNAVRGKMKDGSLAEVLASEVKTKTPQLDNATPISMSDFVSNVLPSAKSIDLFLENGMLNNFVSLTAPVADNPARLLRWGNDFAWSYDGNVTDSIKQKVKRAGGNVDAKLRVSLSWFNKDDLDIHVHEPNGNHIYFGNKQDKLDVDMNVSCPVRDAVENVSWNKMTNGTYSVVIHNYNRRESVDVGFIVEIETNGVLHSFSYDKPVVGNVDVFRFTVANGEVTNIIPSKCVSADTASKEKWGIKTNALVSVDSLMLSPNYWDDNKVGNQHWFFMLHDCKNPEPTRSLYNEFLHPNLEQHRKVFEILGDKMKCPVSDDQLSGVGFSSTRKDKVKVVVSKSRAYHITF